MAANVFDSISISESVNVVTSAPDSPILFIGSTGSRGFEVYQFLDGLTDDGAPINFNLETHNLPFSANFETIVEPRSVLVEIKEGSNVGVYVAYDDGAFMQVGTVKRGYTQLTLDADANDDEFPRCRNMKIALREYSGGRCTVSRLAVLYYETQDNEDYRL